MKNTKAYFTYRIQLEKLKQKTWALIVLAKLLPFLAPFLALLFSNCVGRS